MRGDRDDGARADQAARAEAHRADTYVLGEDELRAELQGMLAGGGPPTGGPLLGLPPLEGDVWCDVAGASLLVGYGSHTISGWLSRGQPADHPFPPPEIRMLYRNYWRASVLRGWVAAGGAGTSRPRPQF